ncbi:uncharacterized protein LOC126985564 isoform X2 [Eriocheir sinensis]|uniref:uncharacterized protein LOC126985564 isoform X2 n=1 Tax=Eriocheir sinensis TaxID=95602 RepID=UPI0021CA7C7F|nr:uncharacterized protein LOC126985564 isoform X2 [Eriocheir sinensis]
MTQLRSPPPPPPRSPVRPQVCAWRAGSDRGPRMLGGLLAAALLALAGLACAHPDTDATDALDVGVSKRDLEFNQYVPGYRRRGEPSCEELREMWRLSKREARRATTTNQLPRRTQHPTYGRLIPFAPEAKPYSMAIYGTQRPYLPAKGHSPSPFDKVRSLLGPGDRRNRFNQLRRMVAATRGPNQSSKGSMDNLIRIMASEGPDPRPVALALRATKDVYPLGHKPRGEPPAMSPRSMRGGSVQYSQQGFVGPLLPADSRLPSFTPWQPAAPDPSLRSCEEVQWSFCRANSDCSCAGLYRCHKGRCKVSSKHPVVEDARGSWYAGPLEAKDLGVWSKR